MPTPITDATTRTAVIYPQILRTRRCLGCRSYESETAVSATWGMGQKFFVVEVGDSLATMKYCLNCHPERLRARGLRWRIREIFRGFDNEKLRSIVVAEMTEEEKSKGVSYVSKSRITAGSVLKLGGNDITVPWNAVLAFIDREPKANWGHSSRYILIGRQGGETISVESRFPPVGGNYRRWIAIYVAPGVPDPAMAGTRHGAK